MLLEALEQGLQGPQVLVASSFLPRDGACLVYVAKEKHEHYDQGQSEERSREGKLFPVRESPHQ